MRSLSEIRHIATRLFRAQRGAAILVVLIYTLIVSGLSVLAYIPILGSLILSMAMFMLQAGLWGSFLKGVRGERMDTEDLFLPFTGGRFGRVLGGNAWLFLKVFAWMLPGLVLFMGGFTWAMVSGLSLAEGSIPQDQETLLSLSILPAFLIALTGYFLMLVLGIIKEYSYILTTPILMENPGVCATYAVTLSKRIMAGHKWQLFLLSLSFLGWQLLSLLTLGILGIVYVTPRLQMTLAAFYYEVKTEALANGRVRPEEFLGAKYE